MKNWKEECNYRRIKDENGVVIANIIMIDGQDIPVSGEVYAAYSQMARQERYQEELREEIPHVSLEMLTEACVPIEEYARKQTPSPEDICIAKEDRSEFAALLLRLPEALRQLTEAEQELIRALYFEGMSLREYCRSKGVPAMTQHYRLQQIIKKIKYILS